MPKFPAAMCNSDLQFSQRYSNKFFRGIC